MESKPSTTDRAHDVLRQEGQQLDAIFCPKTVAVIGATENQGSVGRTVLWNLVSNTFGGTIFPVNPKRESILGIKAYPSIAAVPAKVDLAVIVTPASSVPSLVQECADAGVRGIVVISAGFKEMGPSGEELERQILEKIRKARIRLIGPNCLGVMNPLSGLNVTFASGMARPGNVAFISQSGALCTAVLDWSFKEHVGFSAFVSIGSMLDVDWGDLINYFGNDSRTNAILIYMESIGNARSFLSAAREVALTKPIIVIKPGRTEAAAKAAASHTGSLAGGDDVVEAAFRRCGVLRVNNISDLFYMAEVLAKQPRPKGKRLTILTNAGGPGVLATDAVITSGGQLTPLSKETYDALNAYLPPHWSRNNPVDILGDAKADRYAKALEICAKDPNADGLLVVLTPQDMTEPTQTAEALRAYAKSTGKPVLASWMGGASVAAGDDILNRAGIPTFPYPDTAARAFNYMWRYQSDLAGLYEIPPVTSAEKGEAPDYKKAAQMIETARKEGRNILTESESKQLLSIYGIPTVPTEIVTNENDAVKFADKFGYPVVLKLHSHTITHKTDVGGVKLNLDNAQSVKAAFNSIKTSVSEKVGASHFQGVTVQPMVKLGDGYEVILGSTLDAQFGPVLLFGTGGQLVEVFKDRVLALPPLNANHARRMIDETKIGTALKGVRGRKSVDLLELEAVMIRFSRLVVEQRWIKEIDINPLFVSPERILALDARVVLHDKAMTEEKLPPLSIRPYPVKYTEKWKAKDGTELTIRPIQPEDEPMLVHFHQTISERSVRMRYFEPLKLSQRVTHERLIRVCHADYVREMPLIVIKNDPKTNQSEALGVGRLSKIPGQNEAEFAVLISDLWQNKGLGTKLLSMILQMARDEKLSRLSAHILPENVEMQAVCKKLGLKLVRDTEDNDVLAEMKL